MRPWGGGGGGGGGGAGAARARPGRAAPPAPLNPTRKRTTMHAIKLARTHTDTFCERQATAHSTRVETHVETRVETAASNVETHVETRQETDGARDQRPGGPQRMHEQWQSAGAAPSSLPLPHPAHSDSPD